MVNPDSLPIIVLGVERSGTSVVAEMVPTRAPSKSYIVPIYMLPEGIGSSNRSRGTVESLP